MSEWIIEVLSRDPIPVRDDTDPQALASELQERLAALLSSHNGLEPTLDGWRDLALALALEYEPAFRIETPEDRASLGGRPVGWNSFILRSRMKAEMRKGKTQSEAARAVSKEFGTPFGTAMNIFSRKSQAPDALRRAPYERKTAAAARVAAEKLSQE